MTVRLVAFLETGRSRQETYTHWLDASWEDFRHPGLDRRAASGDRGSIAVSVRVSGVLPKLENSCGCLAQCWMYMDVLGIRDG